MQAKVVVFLFLLSAGSIYAQQKMMPKYQVYKQKRREACFQKYGPCGPLYSHLFEDIIRINLDLLTWDSYKILVSIFPFYLAARMLDDDIHANFYCYVHHKNKNQFPDWCNKGAQYGLSIPLIALGSLAFLGRDDEMRLLGWSIILALGEGPDEHRKPGVIALGRGLSIRTHVKGYLYDRLGVDALWAKMGISLGSVWAFGGR